jgi:TPR repeat protein
MKLYRLAAAQGAVIAANNIGLLYAKGLGVPQDLVRAYMWFSLGATSGHPEPIRHRDLIFDKLSPEQVAQAQKMAQICLVRQWKDCD